MFAGQTPQPITISKSSRPARCSLLPPLHMARSRLTAQLFPFQACFVNRKGQVSTPCKLNDRPGRRPCSICGGPDWDGKHYELSRCNATHDVSCRDCEPCEFNMTRVGCGGADAGGCDMVPRNVSIVATVQVDFASLWNSAFSIRVMEDASE